MKSRSVAGFSRGDTAGSSRRRIRHDDQGDIVGAELDGLLPSILDRAFKGEL
jgi:hypothetical protein